MTLIALAPIAFAVIALPELPEALTSVLLAALVGSIQLGRRTVFSTTGTGTVRFGVAEPIATITFRPTGIFGILGARALERWVTRSVTTIAS